MTLKGAAAITGIGELVPSRDTESTGDELLMRVAREAVSDAGIGFEDVDGVVSGSGSPLSVAERLGIRPTYAGVAQVNGASGAGMVWRAAAAILSGQATTVLCTIVSPMRAPRPSRPRPPSMSAMLSAGSLPGIGGPAEFEAPYGPMGVNSGYAMVAQRHAYEFGTKDRQRAKVAVDQRTNATMNPAARFRDPITIEDVLASRMVVDPLHLLEIVSPCAGGSAYVVRSPRLAREGPHAPVWLLGAAEKVEPHLVARMPNITTTPIAYTAPRAFEMAGVKPSDMDLVSAYDCYTIMVLVTLEDAGFCPKGSGGPFVEEHDLTYSGDLPVNTHGGQLSFGQPGGAGGATHVTEAVRQLRGAAGDRQIRDCELAFVNGNGGIMAEEVSLVLGR